jgi:twitching motility protein PilT
MVDTTTPVAHEDRQPLVTDNEDHLRATPLRKYFEAACKHEASDLLIKAGQVPRLRLKGELRKLGSEAYDPEQFEKVIHEFLNEEQAEHFARHGYIDMAYDFDEDNRFRVNVYRQRGHSALAARRITSQILSYEELHLPKLLESIANRRQGLILLCGVTGSGKSTTIASMIQQINESRPCHIITLEDPIEFIFKDAKAIVSQREVGVDVPSFEEGLRSMVRENPDVVFIGELRDRDTFEAALRAAETGHLVFGTIHASSASQSFGRIYNLFEQNERDLIRDMLASNLVAIVYQKLLPSLREDLSRVPAVEVLQNNAVVSKYIEDKREPELADVIRNAEGEGMIDMTRSLVGLVEKEYIHPKVAMENAPNADELKMRLKGIRSGGG